MSWELKGKYPAILADPVVGAEARDLFEQASAMLAQLVRDRSLKAHGVYGFFPANSAGDDVVVYTDESRTKERCRFHLGGETRDGERQTRRRVADGYCIVKSKESIRNDLHSSKRRGERQAQRPFSRRENSGSPSGRRVSHAAWVRLTFKFSIDMGRHDGVPCNRRRGI